MLVSIQRGHAFTAQGTDSLSSTGGEPAARKRPEPVPTHAVNPKSGETMDSHLVRRTYTCYNLRNANMNGYGVSLYSASERDPDYCAPIAH